MRLRILGCGTSSGVPRIGNQWGKCDPEEPRNRRTRASVLIESGGETLLVDCGPDFREQMNAANLDLVDKVFITHDHADHCHGLDDLRQLFHVRGAPQPLYAHPETMRHLKQRFHYAFAARELYPSFLDPHEVVDEMTLGDARVRFVAQPHGHIFSSGLRVEDGVTSLVYAIDFNEMTDEMRALYKGADVMVCDCLFDRPHPTHAHLDAVIRWSRELGIGRTYLSHMSNGLDYRTLCDTLPPNIFPAYDGMELQF
jgi:phosphoribosyl 1,2-cyclic phosphate phosphodiesterase